MSEPERLAQTHLNINMHKNRKSYLQSKLFQGLCFTLSWQLQRYLQKYCKMYSRQSLFPSSNKVTQFPEATGKCLTNKTQHIIIATPHLLNNNFTTLLRPQSQLLQRTGKMKDPTRMDTMQSIEIEQQNSNSLDLQNQLYFLCGWSGLNLTPSQNRLWTLQHNEKWNKA